MGCCNDALTHQYKGQTVLSESDRYKSLWHCKCVHLPFFGFPDSARTVSQWAAAATITDVLHQE